MSKKFSISNIVWNKGINNFEAFLSKVRKNNFDAVELALNCIWEEPVEINKDEIKKLRDLVQSKNLKISSLHALTYTRPDLNIFNSKKSYQDSLDYILKYSDIADILDAEHLVLGSPSLRKTYGKHIQDCRDIFNSFLEEYSEHTQGVSLNIEPLPPNICEFLNNYSEAEEFANNYKHINVQLDLRVLIELGLKEIPKSKKIRHCQVSNPGMTFHENIYDAYHKSYSHQLEMLNYSNYMSAEVLCPDNFDNDKYIDLVCSKIKNIYG